MSHPSRRKFLKSTVTAAFSARLGVWAASELFAASPVTLDALASPRPTPLPIKKAADGANVRVDSVMNLDHWKYPLSSADSAVVEKSLAGMRTSLRNAKLWGSDAVLLVPAVVNAQTSYRDAWSRSQAQIRKLLPF